MLETPSVPVLFNEPPENLYLDVAYISGISGSSSGSEGLLLGGGNDIHQPNGTNESSSLPPEDACLSTTTVADVVDRSVSLAICKAYIPFEVNPVNRT